MATNAGEGDASSSSSWPDLPPELLGMVLLRVPSLTDRVHLAASCRSWRSGARLQPPLPAPAPWLVLGDKAYLDLGNGAVHTMAAVPGGTGEDCCCRGFIGDDWLFLTRDGGDCFVVNPFSGAALLVPDLASFRLEDYTAGTVIEKVVASAPLPTSSTPVPRRRRRRAPLVAALIKNTDGVRGYTFEYIFVCRAGVADREHSVASPWWFTMFTAQWVAADIEFFRGELYALERTEELVHVVVVEEAGINGVRVPTVAANRIVIQEPQTNDFWECAAWYLVGSGDRLLMVKRWRADGVAGGRTNRFEVLEADFGAGDELGRWVEAGSLRGHALFVSSHGSKSLPASECSGGSVVQEDCIYFIHEDDVRDRDERRPPGDPLGDAGVYNVRDKTFAPFPAPEAAVPRRRWGRWTPTWLFPAQTR